MAITELSLSGVTASKADIRIRDKVNEIIRALNALASQPVPVPGPIAPTPGTIPITAEQEAAIMAVAVGEQFTLGGPTADIICVVTA